MPKNESEDLTGNFTNILLQSCIESIKDTFIFSIDTSYRFVAFNQAFSDATKKVYGTSVIKGALMPDCITLEEERNKAISNCDRALSGESITTQEVYGELEPTYFETRYIPVFDDFKNVIGAVVLSQDITRRKKTENDIKEINHELESFSYSVAHDLRSPLRSITGYTNILEEDYKHLFDPEGQRVIDVIRNSASRMELLIEGLLNFSRLGRKQLTKSIYNPEENIRDILENQLTETEKKRVQITIGEIHPLKGDPLLLNYVFQNLLSNALKFSKEKNPARIEVNSRKDDEGVTYSIRDNGAGFDMNYVDRLFSVFYRLHKQSAFEGIGIGLAITKKIIMKHGGKIWAIAEVDNGAEFSFWLPDKTEQH